jgi:hypothetical protein
MRAFCAHPCAMRKPLFIGLILGLLTTAGSAAAQYPAPLPPPPPQPGYGYPPPPMQMQMPQRQRFGDAGQLAISNDTNFAFTGASTSNNGGSSWTLTLAPAVDYFVIQNLSVGGIVLFTHTETSSGSTPTTPSITGNSNLFGIGARVGYNINITETISWWPKLALLYNTTSSNPGGQNNASISTNAFDVQVYAPFLLHPINHFFLGIGPFVQTDLTASQSSAGVSVPNPGKVTVYGLMFDLGGWMDF